MKQFATYSLLLLLSVLGFSSCTDDQLYTEKPVVKEGLPATIAIPFSPIQSEMITTRALEDNIRDLYIFVFSKEGVLVSRQYYSSSDIAENSEGSVKHYTTSGERIIAGIANLTTNSLAVTKSELDNIGSLAEFQNLTVNLSDESIHVIDGRFLMSGYYGGMNGYQPATCLINSDNNKVTLDGTTTDKIQLHKLQSKISFNIGIGEKVSSFTVDSFSLSNIPSASFLGDQEKSLNSGYFSLYSQKELDQGAMGFTFYMLENKYTTSGLSVYEEREALNSPVNSDDFANAPGGATYVTFYGRYQGKAYRNGTGGAEYDVDAYVKYNVHLGYVGNNVNDFNSLRNKHYTYNITINGVNSIVLEVIDGSKNYDRGDGDVYFSTGNNLKEYDAHYATEVISFTRRQLRTTFEETAFQILVYSNNTQGFEAKDTDWVQFVKNGIGSDKNKKACYPGSGSSFLWDANAFIDDLKALRDDTTIPENDSVYYTCFINEYYDTDTNWKEYVNQQPRIMMILCNSTGDNGSHVIDAAYIFRQKSIQTFYNVSNVNSAWGIEWENETTNYHNQLVNGKLLPIGLPYGSPVRAATDRTNGRYNTIQEVGLSQNWYSNQNVKPSESSTLLYEDYHSNLSKAYAACMQRNRDENGNGIIDEGEMKWYLPAIYQYTDIAVGMAVLPQGAQLYSSEDYNFKKDRFWLFKHYVSNSGKLIYWAEESGPFGNYGGGSAVTGGISYSDSRHIRCIRNLGPNSAKTGMTVNDKPDDFANYSSYIIDLSNTNRDALRTTLLTDGELNRHDERSILSRPYTKFKIASIDFSSRKWMNENRTADNSGISSCSEYSEGTDDLGTWRIPNMRELLLMNSRMGLNGNFMSRTYYSFYLNDWLNIPGNFQNQNGTLAQYSIFSPMNQNTPISRRGFSYNGSYVHLINPDNNANYSLRCVKDIP